MSVSIPRDTRLFIITKTANQQLDDDDTLQNDTHLKMYVEANGVREGFCSVIYTGNATADMKVQWAVPASASMRWLIDLDGSLANDETSIYVLSANPALKSIFKMPFIFQNGATAGYLQLTWAQNVKTSAPTEKLTMYANSYILAHKVA